MRPVIYTIPQMPTMWLALLDDRVYRFAPAGWSERVELFPNPVVLKQWTREANRASCNDYPVHVFNQLILGVR